MRRLDPFLVAHDGLEITVQATRVDDCTIVSFEGIPGAPWFAQIDITAGGRLRVTTQRSKGWPLPVLGCLTKVLSDGPLAKFVAPKPGLSVVDGGAA